MKNAPVLKTIKHLEDIRQSFGADEANQKLALLESLSNSAIKTATDARRLHKYLCFARAFPDSPRVYDQAANLLKEFETIVGSLSRRARDKLDDSGIAGTNLYYAFSFQVAAWMARRFPRIAVIDWSGVEDTSRLDEILDKLLEYSETAYFDSGRVSTEEWLHAATTGTPGTDFDWLMFQLDERKRNNQFWTTLYNKAEISLRCKLADSGLAIGNNRFGVDEIYFRNEGMHNRIVSPKLEIIRPLSSLHRLKPRKGSELVDVAMSSLAVRHRETIHFDYANPAEVYLADIGQGIQIAVTGLKPEHRYPLECTMGYLILSNGVPIGYGGASMLFKQANVGINVFEEYRGSDAAWFWLQVMRVFHAISGCTRFIVNPYQFGSENDDALKSGAFWFYYRLGYRPVDPDVRQLARREAEKIRLGKKYRSPIAQLKLLAQGDMHLTLKGARQGELFDERWIDVCSLLVTRQIARTGELSRKQALASIARKVRQDLGLRSLDGWSAQERSSFERFCPVVAAADPSRWLPPEKELLIALMRSKGGRFEIDYVRLLAKHPHLFAALKRKCRQIV